MITFSLDICADCPFCEEGNVESDFYCKHPKRPEESLDTVPLFDGVPDWCPIRKDVVTLAVRGCEPKTFMEMSLEKPLYCIYCLNLGLQRRATKGNVKCVDGSERHDLCEEHYVEYRKK